jgi:predicted DNA-binding transcriptional regulator AlpA
MIQDIESPSARALAASTLLPFSAEPIGDRILALREIIDLTGLSRSTLERLIREGDGPPRVRLSARGVRAWLAAREPA